MPNALLPKPQPLVERSGKKPPTPQNVGDLFLDDATAQRVNTLVQKGALHGSHTRPARLHQGRGPSRAQTSARRRKGGREDTRELLLKPAFTLSAEFCNRHPFNHILRLRVSMWPHPWSAWMVALREPNKSPRPTSVGETFRRLTPKVAVVTTCDGIPTPWSMGTTVEAQLSLTRWPP